jgi:Ni/Co efflux regulator RcnB
MKKTLTGATAVLTAISCVLSAVPASAQQRWRDSDRDGIPDSREWNRDRDRDGRADQYDRYDNRRYDWRHDRRGEYRWRNYGDHYGYNGYRGRWRTGERFTYYDNPRYVISDWRAYDLPPPRRGYRYYRDDNGDVVMVASGIIGMILGSALSDDHHRRW